MAVHRNHVSLLLLGTFLLGSVLQGRGETFDPDVVTSSFTDTNFGGDRINYKIGEMTARAHNPDGKDIGVRTKYDNKIYKGNEVLCDDVWEKRAEPTYQKSTDGTLWYTNLVVGEPMTQEEIDGFEKEWAEYQKVRKEKREAERKRRNEEREKKRKEREEKRKRMDEEREKRQARRQKRDEDRKQERKEREAEKRRRDPNGYTF